MYNKFTTDICGREERVSRFSSSRRARRAATNARESARGGHLGRRAAGPRRALRSAASRGSSKLIPSAFDFPAGRSISEFPPQSYSTSIINLLLLSPFSFAPSVASYSSESPSTGRCRLSCFWSSIRFDSF